MRSCAVTVKRYATAQKSSRDAQRSAEQHCSSSPRSILVPLPSCNRSSVPAIRSLSRRSLVETVPYHRQFLPFEPTPLIYEKFTDLRSNRLRSESNIIRDRSRSSIKVAIFFFFFLFLYPSIKRVQDFISDDRER